MKLLNERSRVSSKASAEDQPLGLGKSGDFLISGHQLKFVQYVTIFNITVHTMDADASPAGTRPYRSKLKRPCDRCRSRKIACILPESGPCRNCWNVGKSCTFDKPPNPRNRDLGNIRASAKTGGFSPSFTTSPDGSSEHVGFERSVYGNPAFPVHTSVSPRGCHNYGKHALPTTNGKQFKPAASFGSLDAINNIRDTPKIQHIRSLDQLNASTAQLFGTSAESDPWLLRHCKYDDNGMRHLHGIHFRNVGGVPVEGLVPVHFLVTEDSLLAPHKEATLFSAEVDVLKLRAELNMMIPTKFGVRLVLL